jgi:hypothetical protein
MSFKESIAPHVAFTDTAVCTPAAFVTSAAKSFAISGSTGAEGPPSMASYLEILPVMTLELRSLVYLPVSLVACCCTTPCRSHKPAMMILKIRKVTKEVVMMID